jgi:magnesium-transporting ATPase (P-type)
MLKGAPEVVLRACRYVQIDDQVTTLPEEFPLMLAAVIGEMTSQGQRVIALAYRPKMDQVDLVCVMFYRVVCILIAMHLQTNRDHVNAEMCFLGLVGIYDPPRPESGPSVLKAQAAGISVHMLTGAWVLGLLLVTCV